MHTFIGLWLVGWGVTLFLYILEYLSDRMFLKDSGISTKEAVEGIILMAFVFVITWPINAVKFFKRLLTPASKDSNIKR